MTRLTTNDIEDISETLSRHELQLRSATHCGILGIGCHAYGVDENLVHQKLSQLTACVVPVTSGEGVISGFSETVQEILSFLGLKTQVTDLPDVGGLNQAFRQDADIVLMSDDDHFIAFNLQDKMTVHNSEATGKAFAAALDLVAMADGRNSKKDAAVMGCGPVGTAGAKALLDFGFNLCIYDTQLPAAKNLESLLRNYSPRSKITFSPDVNKAISCNRYILEATPAPNTIAASCLNVKSVVAAPGVPLGITAAGVDLLGERAIHDKLELGVAAMLAGLFV